MTMTTKTKILGVLVLGLCGGARAAFAAPAGDKWLGDDLPLPMPVKTPQDIGFKSATERQYLIFNLMAGGKLAFQHGDYATAADKWETLLRMPGLDPQVERVVTPFLNDARARAGKPGARPEPPPAEPSEPEPVAEEKPAEAHGRSGGGARHATGLVSVAGIVTGGGQIGPGGTVIWLRRLDGSTPRVAPAANQIVTQRDKTFLPHILAVPVGTSVQFRNDDRIYHNVFSIAKPNEFDAGIRPTGSTYSKVFNHPGAVELLCNIHSTMSAYVFVVDSPLYTKAQASGAFAIHGVAPGRYELSAWHEAASTITRKTVAVGAEGNHEVSVPVGGDKRPGPFVPDKYGHKRQPQLGY
jgi:plastocyanin